MNVPVGVALRVRVIVGVLVLVGVEVAVDVGVEVGVFVAVAEKRAVIVAVGVWVAVAERPAVGDAIPDVAVGVWLPDGEAVGEADASAVGLADAGVRVEDGNCVGDSVLVIGAVGGSLKHATGEIAIQRSGVRSVHLEKKPRRARLPVGGCIRLIAIG